MAQYYNAADIGISVPYSDGTPSSVLECMACGTPVILSDLPSLRVWATHDKDALFVPNGDFIALAKAIILLLQDSKKYSKMARNAKNIQDRIDYRIWMNKADLTYQKLTQAVSIS
jgi:glycosyltransferase involved in cell wall biosynthesis